MGARMPLPADAAVTYDDAPAARLPLPPGASVTFDDAPQTAAPVDHSAEIHQAGDKHRFTTADVLANALNKQKAEKEAADYEAIPVHPTGVIPTIFHKGMQGLTAGFSDEIMAAIDAATDTESSKPLSGRYADARNSRRKTLDVMGDTRPKLSGVSEFGGSILSGAALPASKFASIPRAMAESAALGSVAGLGYSNADLTKGEYAQAGADMLRSGTTAAALTGVVAKGIRGAPERVTGRLASDAVIGETTAKRSLRSKVEQMAGDENARLDEVARATGLRRTLAVTAQPNPGAAFKRVSNTTKKINADVLDPSYEKMDAVNDIGRTQVVADLGVVSRALHEEGRTAAAKVIDQHVESLIKAGESPGASDMIKATALRNMKRELGPEAFKTDHVTVPAGEEARRMVYAVLDDALKAKALRTPGVDPAAIAKANREISTLIPVEQSLYERAQKAKGGSLSWTTVNDNKTALGVAAGLALTGHTGPALAAVAVPVAKKLAARGYRLADYEVAKLVEAARNGSRGAQLAQFAIETGVARAAAPRVARIVDQALSSQDEPTKPAGIEPSAD